MSWDTNLDMTDDAERARQYRERAAEMRAVAAWMKERSAVTQVLAMALEYERMANAIEKLRAKKVEASDGPRALRTD